jgi:hypothetical protein
MAQGAAPGAAHLAGRSSKEGTGLTGKYPDDWPAISQAAKDAVGNRCERCRHPAERPWKLPAGKQRGWGPEPCDGLCNHPADGKQRVLTVHHLDGHKPNCAAWNLAVLCQVCHLSIQGRVTMRQLFMLDHTSWMLPHVEGMLREAAEAVA